MELIVHCSPKQVMRLGEALAFPVEDPEGGIKWELPRWYHALMTAACAHEQRYVERAR